MTANPPMPNVNESLNRIMEIEGAIGAALVDYTSGKTLGTVGGGNLDMELAGAASTEVVRAKQATIDRMELDERIQDILVTMSTQYHLTRVLHQHADVFAYVVLDKENAALANARRKLKQIDGTLQLT